ncbi:MAG: orotidine-5'-phosphate decarboxylase [Nannocystaceae bacterium]|nr:orotidine-5'-phosphate decarboxylase [Nannocystaceae bacterium]
MTAAGVPPTDRPDRERLIVALDVPSADVAFDVAGRLSGHVGMFKIGLELFVAEGPQVVRRMRELAPDVDIFLDLKLHDIPNTMRGAIRSVRTLGVKFVTVHAGSGTAHLAACVEEAGDAVGILAVTVLTSQDDVACRQAGHTRALDELVEMRAVCAREAGCAGVVCSGRELGRVRAVAPKLARVVPGIRPAGADLGDQQRVMTPARAVAEGATHIVVGRPILQAEDQAAAADAIVRELAQRQM